MVKNVKNVFKNFDVDFWPLLKAEKKQFWQKKKFIFYHPYESINFQPAGLLKIALIVTTLLKEISKKKLNIFQ